jgi:CheY-like chemotaxis protein
MSEQKSLVLVVDDFEPNRLKLSTAIRSLGHDVEVAIDGRDALGRLRKGGIDLVLLDIVMPEVDGFEVLLAMKSDEALKEIPVLVISSLEETDEVVKAITLGAEDFLTKRFDPVLLRARVNTCLERKRLRDRELDYLADVERLSMAARILEKKDFDPKRLGLEGVAARPEPLGDLARVFLGMADQIYRRELFYRRQISLLQGSIMLILMGTFFGMAPALSRFVMLDGLNPIGLTAWILLFSTCVSFVGCVVTGTWPRFERRYLPYLLTLAILGTLLPEIALLWVAEHVPAMALSIIVALEAIVVFVIAALLGMESPNLRRFIGLCLGLGCVLFLIMPAESVGSRVDVMWILAALLVPLCYASEDLLLAAPREPIPPMALVFAISVIGLLVAGPLALVSGTLVPMSELTVRTGAALMTIAVASVLGTFLLIQTVRTNGAVFASQVAYTITLAGIVWSIVLLDEQLSIWVVAAGACMISGLVLVRPNHDAEKSDEADLAQLGFGQSGR